MASEYKIVGATGSAIPEYIGYPTHQLTSSMASDGVPADIFKKQMEEKMVYAVINPMLAKIGGDQNIYEPRGAIGQFASDLQNAGIQDVSHIPLKVVLSNFTPVTERYSNEYGDSEILGTANKMGGKLQEALTITGAKDVTELKNMAKTSKNDFIKTWVGGLLEKWEQGTNAGRNLGLSLAEKGHKTIGGLIGAASDMLASPWSKIGWPQMWKNCSYQSTYELNTRLYCFNTDDDISYRSNIQAALAALQMFVQPRSSNGVLYTTPYMMEFAIPGMIYIPLGYCSDMTVVKGGDTGDFSANGRPNIIDVRMTIQNVFSISVNCEQVDKKYPFRPTVRREQEVLGGGKDLHKPTSYQPAKEAPKETYSTYKLTKKEIDEKMRKYIEGHKKYLKERQKNEKAEDAREEFESILNKQNPLNQSQETPDDDEYPTTPTDEQETQPSGSEENDHPTTPTDGGYSSGGGYSSN